MTEVYLLSYDRQLTGEEFSFFYEYVDEIRRRKSERYRMQKDRDRCILAGALLKHALTHYGAERDRFEERDGKYGTVDLCVLTDENGKPYIEGGPEFSISHAGAWVGVAVSDRPVGLDIEGGRVFQDVAVAKFAKDEQEWYRKLSAEEKESGFYRIWTGKEAYSKRDGRGMGMGLSSFSIFEKSVADELVFKKMSASYYMSVSSEEKWEKNPVFLEISDLIK